MTTETGVTAEETRQFLSFILDGEVFALDVARIREILDSTTITRIPRMPGFMRGVINLRGSVVPVIDLRTKFDLGAVEQTVDTCIVVIEVRIDGDIAVIGALVDAVDEVFELDPGALSAPPKIGAKLQTEFIESMAKREDGFVIVLDVDHVFSVDDVIAVREVAQATNALVEAAEPVEVAAE